MASTQRLGPISYTTDKSAPHQDFKAIFNISTQSTSPVSNNLENHTFSLNTTADSAALAISHLNTLPTPLLIVSDDEALASGLALIFLASQAKLAAEDAIRLGAALKLPAVDNSSIADWVSTSTTHIVTGASDNFIFKQLFEPESSTFTYLLADSTSKEAILIDPVDVTVDRDLAEIEALGLNLVMAINTHCHADHVTGTGLLKQRVPGLKSGIAASSGAKADVLFSPGDVNVVKFGKHTLNVIPTPGHTNGCVSYYTASGGGMVFTGDALLIRGCGRTDFQEGSPNLLYQSVHSNLFTLPPCTVVYPAHDYRNRSKSSVIEEKLLNPRLTKGLDGFVEIMNSLNLPRPKAIDRAVPANMVCGVQDILS